MSSSSRSSVPSPPQIKLRKRAKTQVLLGDEYLQNITGVDKPPKRPEPHENPAEYDNERIKQGLKYADFILRNPQRKLPPLGIHGLEIYKDACIRLLDMEQGEAYEDDEKAVQAAREEWIAQLRMYERSMIYNACLNATRTTEAQELQEAILKLQRSAWYIRYGDIFAEACKGLRSEAEARKVDGWKTLSRNYWTTIYQTIKEEEAAFKRVRNGEGGHEECPTHIAISQTCTRVGFDMDDMLEIIDQYAIRNSLVHCDLVPMIKEGRYMDLIKMMHNDLCDVPKVVPPGEEFQSKLMTNIIEAMIDLWFVRNPDDRDNFQGWGATDQLRQYRERLLKANPQDQEHPNEEASKTIMAAVAKRFRQKQVEDGVRELLEGTLEIISGGKQIKRVASSDLEAEKKKAKIQHRQFNAILSMSAGLRKISDTYMASYGEPTWLADIVEDLTLN
jgi:hypothetical protein